MDSGRIDGRLPPRLVPIRCPDCARADQQAVALLVADGPGVAIRTIHADDRQPMDACGYCPCCGKLYCVRVLRPAA